MSKLDEALVEYDKKDYKKSYYSFKEYRENVEDKTSFDRLYSYKFMKTIFEVKLKGLNKLDKEVQEDIIYIIKHSTSDNFYYKLSIFETIDILENNINANWNNILVWIKKLNPDYLETKKETFISNGKTVTKFSELERYYLKITKAYEKLEDYENLYLYCNEALSKISYFTNNSDIWYKRRLAMCHYKKEQYEQAINLYKDILLIKKDWYLYKEIGNLYEKMNDKNNALVNYFEAFTKSNDSSKVLSFVYHLYNFINIEQLKRKMFILYISLKNDRKLEITKEDDNKKTRLNISGEELSKINTEQYFRFLKKEINNLKLSYQDRKIGIVISVNEKFCFIEDSKQNRYYCNTKEFPRNVKPELNMKVEFTLTESFDKKKNQKSYIATNVKIKNWN